MCGDKSARMIIKTGSGVPTIPVSADHRNGDWIATDIYEGESYMDTDTGIVYTRNGSSIESVGGGGGATNVLATAIVNIGDWNMDSTTSVSVAHGIADFTKIRNIDVLIINDTSTDLEKLSSCDILGVGNGRFNFNSTDVILFRVTSGGFDGTDYDATSFNRGYIIITYVI